MIRYVTAEDSDFVLESAKKFIEYQPTPLSWDEDHVSRVLEHIANEGSFLIHENSEGIPTGMVGVIYTPHVFDPTAMVGTEVFLWVDEKYRNGFTMIRLLKAMESECDGMGCDQVIMSSTSLTPKFGKFLTNRMGYDQFETAYIKVLR